MQVSQISLNRPEDVLESQKKSLTRAKDSLARPDFGSLKRNDPWEKAIRLYRRQIIEKSGGQNVTKAWLKMYEILTLTPVGSALLQMGNQVNAFFNAELPGGFIYAANHFLKTNGRLFDWVIASYLPQVTHGKNFLPDEFDIISKYPKRTLVGSILTNRGNFWSDGDLTNPKMPAILATLARSRLNPIHLYTADGGFDVEGQENIQEELSLPLIRGEVECGLRSINPGGIMIIKIFTFFTPQMWTLLVFLMRAFQNYDIFKPKTSGPLNSESYFIGIGYRGLNNEDLAVIMKDPRDNETRYAIPSKSENDFLIDKITSFTDRQINNIERFLGKNGPKLEVELNIQPLQVEDQL
ncbi:hypothetical protein BH23THE1_BH23THE1_32630 [soil metagenome]